MDISQVLDILNKSRETTAGLQGQAESAFGATKTAVAAGGTAEQQLLAQKAIVDQQASLGQLNAQKNAREAATSLGTNMDVQSQIVTQIGETMRQSALSMIADQKKVAELDANNNLFSNPLGFLNDLFFGQEIRNKAQASTEVFKSASDALQGLNQATQQTTVSQRAIAEVKTDASLLAEQRQAEAQARQAAALTQQRLAGVDLERIQTMSALDSKQTSLALQAFNAKQSADAAARAQASLDLRTKQDKQKLAGMLESYNVAASKFGRKPLQSEEELNKMMLLDKNRFGWMVQKGYEMQQTGTMTYGSNPIEALANINAMNIKVNPAQEQVLASLNRARAGANNVDLVYQTLVAQTGKAEKALDTQTRISLKEQATKLVTNAKERPQLELTAVGNALQNWMSNINVGDVSNPYSPPALNSFAGAKYLEQNQFLSKYVSPTIATATAPVEFNPDQLLQYGADAIKSGMSTTEVANGLAWLGQQAVMLNNSTKNYTDFGMPHQTALPMATTVKLPGIFGTRDITGIVNWADSASILDNLAKTITSKRSLQEVYTDVQPTAQFGR